MSVSPIRPSEAHALIPTTDDICDGILKLIQTLILWWRYQKYKYQENGQFTPEFEAEICAITCPSSEATPAE